MFRSKKLSLLMALVFAFTVIMPVGVAFAGDEAKFSKSYSYIKSDKDQNAGTVTVEPDEKDTTCDAVYITLTLPDGVEFSSDPKDADIDANKLVQGTNVTPKLVSSDDDYVKVWIDGTNWESDATSVPKVKFDFSDKATGNNKLDIEDDFTGNLDVTMDVEGVTGGSIEWTISDDVTIAKVAESDVTITVGSLKKVSVGGGKEVADIEVEESQAGVLELGKEVTLQIETAGVEFDSVTPIGQDGIGVSAVTFDPDSDGEQTKAIVTITDISGPFPGTIKFDEIKLDIAPDVTGDIEITVDSDDKDVDDETVTVATVGDVTAEVDDLEDNDTVVYCGQEEDLDVEFIVKTTDGSDFEEGDIITFELNVGELKEVPEVDGTDKGVKRYDDDEAFYYTIQASEDDELKFTNFHVELDNDDEAGDLVLTVGGDYGELGDIVIGQAAKPFTVTAEKKSIITEALNLEAGDITITEADDGALKEGMVLRFELPNGVELSGEPKVDEEESNIDVSIDKWDDEYFDVKVKQESSSKPGVFRIYNISYDTGKLAVAGDVELRIWTNPDKDTDEGDEFDENDDTLATVINATVVDQDVVTATFTLGDEGVAVKKGRTLVQVNNLCDVLGLQKSWDAANKIAYFVKDGTVVAFPIEKNEIIINGNVIPVDQGGTIIDGFTYATLRGLEMAFGGKLDWDNETKTATFKF